jgi:hypothetical protein
VAKQKSAAEYSVVSGARRRGRKSTAPPRVSDSGKLPRLHQSRLDHKPPNRVIENIDFASKGVIDALELAGWQASPKLSHDIDPKRARRTQVYLKSWSEIFAGLDVSNAISNLAKFYAFERAYAQQSVQFRVELRAFEKAIAAFGNRIPISLGAPSSVSAINGALKDMWLREATGDVPCPICDEGVDPELIWLARFDLERLRADLDELGRLVGRVRADEPKGGRDANRAAHGFVTGLGQLFTDWTGKPLSRVNAGDRSGNDAVAGPFGRFVKAVNSLLPKDFQLGDIDNLIRACVANSSEP